MNVQPLAEIARLMRRLADIVVRADGPARRGRAIGRGGDNR